jgi:hypothetical protein
MALASAGSSRSAATGTVDVQIERAVEVRGAVLRLGFDLASEPVIRQLSQHRGIVVDRQLLF